MKRMLEGIKLRTWYSKFFLSFVVLSAAMALTVTTLLSQAFSKGSAEQINEISQKRLEQSRSVFEFVLDQARLVALQLSLDNDLIRTMNSPEPTADYFLYSATLRKINDQMLTNKNIYSITLYNGLSDALIGTDRDKAKAEQETIAWLTKSDAVQSLGRAIPRRLEVEGREEPGERVYTVFWYDRNYESREITSAIILNLTLDGFADQRAGTVEGDRFLILDQTGRLVFSPGSDRFLDDLSDTALVERILSSGTNESFIDETGSGKTLVSSVYSEQLGWYFVSAIPYETATKPISDIRRTAIWTCLALLALALVVSAVLSGMLSSPLSRLARKVLASPIDTGSISEKKLSEMEILNRFYANVTEKYERLEATSRSSHLSMKAEYLKELLHGIRVPEPGEAAQYGLNVDPIGGDASLLVAVLKLDGIAELAVREDELDHTVRAVLSDFAERYLKSRIACDVVKVDKEIVLLIGEDGTSQRASLEALSDLQREVAQDYGVTLTIAIGQPVRSGHELGDAYLSAKETALYRLVHGEGKILFYEEIVSKLDSEFEYPHAKQKALLETIKTGKEEKAEAAAADFFSELRRASYPMIRSAVRYLLFSLLSAAAPNSTASTASGSYLGALEELEKMESLQRIEEWFAGYARTAIRAAVTSKKHPKSGLAEDIASFLEEQYGNPELSIELVAERFHYNGIYFGRLFKEMFNRTFLEYVTEMRIRKANELLADSKLTAKEVGEKVGFLNASYFVTWYKKHTGLAPTEYRKQI